MSLLDCTAWMFPNDFGVKLVKVLIVRRHSGYITPPDL
jgi:hypothetical protein